MLLIGVTGRSPILSSFLAGNLAILAALAGRQTSVVFSQEASNTAPAAPTLLPEGLTWNSLNPKSGVLIEVLVATDLPTSRHTGLVVCGTSADLEGLFHVEHVASADARVAWVLSCASHEDFERTILHRVGKGLPQLLPYALMAASTEEPLPVLSNPLGRTSRALLELHQELFTNE